MKIKAREPENQIKFDTHKWKKYKYRSVYRRCICKVCGYIIFESQFKEEGWMVSGMSEYMGVDKTCNEILMMNVME